MSFKKIPTEVFGYSYDDMSIKAKTARKNQYCKYLEGECKKPRKSTPEIKIGSCTLGYKGDFLKEYMPVIICPHRLNTKETFDIIKSKLFNKKGTVYSTTEVDAGVCGSVDYVLFTKDNQGNIDDFLCVEFQGAGTTGSAWDGITDIIEGRPLKESYNYGINWANEFGKTMMQQVVKKGEIIQAWKKNIVFVFQDVGMEFIKSTCNVSGLVPYDPNCPIHFLTIKLVKNLQTKNWDIQFDNLVSTDMKGALLMMNGTQKENHLTAKEFSYKIAAKLSKSVKV